MGDPVPEVSSFLGRVAGRSREPLPAIEKVGKKLNPMRHSICPKAEANW
jgi:hypothetical protein